VPRFLLASRLLPLAISWTLAIAASPVSAPAQDASAPDLETILMGASFLLDDEALAEIEGQGRFGVYPIDTRDRLITIHARLVAPGFVQAKMLASKDRGPVRVIEGAKTGDGPDARTVVEFVEHLEPGEWEFAFGAPVTPVGEPGERRLDLQLLLATKDAQQLPRDPDLCTSLAYLIAHATSAWMLCRGDLVEQRSPGSSKFTGGIPVPGAERVHLLYGAPLARRGAIYHAEFYRGSETSRAHAVYEDLAMQLLECGLAWPEATSSSTTEGWNVTLRTWTRQDGVEIELSLGVPREGMQGDAAVELRVLPPEGL
jgi:hypothetical protein